MHAIGLSSSRKAGEAVLGESDMFFVLAIVATGSINGKMALIFYTHTLVGCICDERDLKQSITKMIGWHFIDDIERRRL